MDQARRIHDRLAGVPPTDQILLDMTDDNNGVGGRTEIDAAYRAMDNPGFYNVTLKNWVAPWTNRDQSVFVPLNDYTATVIGMIRDDVPFNTVLSADIVYVGAGGLGLPAYSMNNNDHYEQMESQGVDLQASLVPATQTAVTDLPAAAIAGVVTTRAAAEAFFVAGTNRAMFRFTLMNHMCNDLEQVKDITRAPDRIRQDVSRSPGGDSRIFLNNCIGCHAGMDPLAQAYAYYDFDEALQRITYTPGQVQPKYFNNDANFPPGFVTPDDSWANYWRVGQNELLGWDPNLSGSGVGAASMGAELANSQAFAQCQMKKVFKAVCLRDPVDQLDRDQIGTMVGSFTSGGSYNMKRSFAEAAVYCKGP
ncbi:MAG: hypothetical protein HKN81_10680 [Gammaproteobacteria bacterium]|nr:hypothetical protein [Gammaproteobacteria bacterium]